MPLYERHQWLWYITYDKNIVESTLNIYNIHIIKKNDIYIYDNVSFLLIFYKCKIYDSILEQRFQKRKSLRARKREILKKDLSKYFRGHWYKYRKMSEEISSTEKKIKRDNSWQFSTMRI